MNPLQESVRRAILERQLRALQRTRMSLEQSHRSMSIAVPLASWSGFARWHFDHATARNNALWKETIDTLVNAEQATRQALWEVRD